LLSAQIAYTRNLVVSDRNADEGKKKYLVLIRTAIGGYRRKKNALIAMPFTHPKHRLHLAHFASSCLMAAVVCLPAHAFLAVTPVSLNAINATIFLFKKNLGIHDKKYN
jgi:hypothetical protein